MTYGYHDNQRQENESVDVDWKEFYYTNCPLISASNVDQELGWVKEEFKKIGVAYKYLRSTRENDWYPHYIHNLDNLMRFGGCFPAIHVHADIRRTRLLGTRTLGGRLHDGALPATRSTGMVDLKGKEDRPLEEHERHQDRLVAGPGGSQGIELMLRSTA